MIEVKKTMHVAIYTRKSTDEGLDMDFNSLDAQFEREVITERIRDKVAAAKKKGMNCGGFPPMGYVSDPDTKKLQIVPEEAEIVKRIFATYLQLGSARDTAATLDAGENGLDPDDLSVLQKAVIQGLRYRDKQEGGTVKTVTELSRQEKTERAFLFRSLSTVNLAPDIVEMILNGTEPKTLTMGKLRKGFPDDWEEQRKLFGI